MLMLLLVQEVQIRHFIEFSQYFLLLLIVGSMSDVWKYFMSNNPPKVRHHEYNDVWQSKWDWSVSHLGRTRSCLIDGTEIEFVSLWWKKRHEMLCWEWRISRWIYCQPPRVVKFTSVRIFGIYLIVRPLTSNYHFFWALWNAQWKSNGEFYSATVKC